MPDDQDSPNNLPIDLALYQSIESKSLELSNELSNHVQAIQQQTKQMSQSTVEAGKVYKLSVVNLSEEINESMKKSIELITQCDELDKDLSQLHELSKQIKSVDKALDQLQQALL